MGKSMYKWKLIEINLTREDGEMEGPENDGGKKGKKEGGVVGNDSK